MAIGGSNRGLYGSVALVSAIVIALTLVTTAVPTSDDTDLRTDVTLGHVAAPPLVPAEPALPLPQPPTEPPANDASRVLRFIYFVEADAELWPEAVDLIDRQAVDLQQFWYEQFGGTFALPTQTVTVVFGEQPAEWYDTTINGDEPRWYRLRNIQDEVWAKLGVTPGDDVRMIVFPATRLDGRVGAIRYNGAWMDGDDVTCIDGIVATVPYASDFPANCLMTVAHELGHVYGLGHQGDSAHCMQLGFYRYVNGTADCNFSAMSRQLVTTDERNAPWLDAVPGDRR
ncbi:MAG: hypothetical protein AAGD35_07465 [Actinomycetota bacterium]